MVSSGPAFLSPPKLVPSTTTLARPKQTKPAASQSATPALPVPPAQWQSVKPPPPPTSSPKPRPPKPQHQPDGTPGDRVEVPPDFVPAMITNPDCSITREVLGFMDSGCGPDLISADLAKYLDVSYHLTGATCTGFSTDFPPLPISVVDKPLWLYIGERKEQILPEVTKLNTHELLIGRTTRNLFGISVGPIPLRYPSEFDVPLPDDYVDLEKPVERVFDRLVLPPAEEKLRTALRADAAIWLKEHVDTVPLNSFIKSDHSMLHVLHEPDTPPAYTHQYPVKPHLRQYVTDQVLLWHKIGKSLIFDVNKHGPFPLYNMPLHPVVTRNAAGEIDKVRVCVDARGLNVKMINDHFPIPYINDIYQGLSQNRFFSEFDLTSAFLQFRVNPDHQHKLGFTWNGINYVFAGSIFGVKHVSSHVQRVLTSIFSDMPFVVIYVDNLLIYSKSIEEHRMHVHAIIDRCTQLNILLNPDKCVIACTEITTLGNVLTTQGVRADPRKVNAVISWPTPESGEDIARFLGVTNFLRGYVRNYAAIAAPLDELRPSTHTKTGTKRPKKPFIWTEECALHFDIMKRALATAPARKFLDHNKTCNVITDSSRYGIGAVLYQPDDPHDFPTSTTSFPSHLVLSATMNGTMKSTNWN